MGRLALRPLLEILAADGEMPDRRAIELLGALGDGDAAPALARIAARALGKPATRDPRHAGFAAREAGMAALVSLARLGDPRGFDVLARAADDPSPSVRRIGLWGLGRTPDPRGHPALLRALDDPQTELQALGCLGLGRAGGRPLDGDAGPDGPDPRARCSCGEQPSRRWAGPAPAAWRRCSRCSTGATPSWRNRRPWRWG